MAADFLWSKVVVSVKSAAQKLKGQQVAIMRGFKDFKETLKRKKSINSGGSRPSLESSSDEEENVEESEAEDEEAEFEDEAVDEEIASDDDEVK